ncbi:MAG: hypothetical protein KH415_23625 [Clostridium sp.]|nr:hypothetical protein [Clostridium sp.]
MLNKIEFTKSLIRDIYYSSKDAHETLFKDYRNEKNELISGILLNKAISSYSCLKAFYYSNLNDLEDYRVEDILNKFDTFINEFLNNLSSGHSHQWTDIEFNAFKNSVFDLLGEI